VLGCFGANYQYISLEFRAWPRAVMMGNTSWRAEARLPQGNGKGMGEEKVFNTLGRSVHLEARFSDKLPLFWLLSTALAALMTLGCATPVTKLQITAPSSVTAGTRFTITVTAVDNGERDAVFDSYVRFSSSDSAALLPGDYQFTAADSGSHTFTNAVTMMTPGKQSLTATMIYAPSINGSTNISVSSGTE